MRLLVPILLAMACACTKHAAPEDALIAQMRVGIERSLAAMGEPAMTPAALDNLASRLCWQGDAAAFVRARDAAMTPETAGRARACIRQIEAHGRGIKAPAMLVWLADHADALSPEQRLLLEATVEQALSEEPKQEPPALAR
jgi:hypothetical protein